MKPNQAGISALLEMASCDLDHQLSPMFIENKDEIISILQNYLSLNFTYEQSVEQFRSLGISTETLDRLKEIKNVQESPLPPLSDQDEINHKKSRPWTALEDLRLLAGILRYGLDNWSTVAMFVGNDRSRAQCSQRWSRGLNPKISKDTWSPDEEALLFSLVQQYGDKSWTKIASLLGNRSDVQCRYHYHQVTKNVPTSPQPNMPTYVEQKNFDLIQSHPNVRQTPRYSLPTVTIEPLSIQATPNGPQVPVPTLQPRSQQTFSHSPMLQQPLSPQAHPITMPMPAQYYGFQQPNNQPSYAFGSPLPAETYVSTDTSESESKPVYESIPQHFAAPIDPHKSMSSCVTKNESSVRFASPSQIANQNSDLDEISIDGFLRMFQ